MAIAFEDLPPHLQAQVMGKGKKGSKMGNKPAQRVMPNGEVHTFDSQKEARRYDELRLLLLAGKISDLKLQPEFTLKESYITAQGERSRAIRYAADFSYRMNGEYIVEDAKGHRTRDYIMKKKLMQEIHGISVKEV